MHICKPFDQFHKNNQIISNFIFLKNSTKREVLAVSSRWWCQELYASTHQGLGLQSQHVSFVALSHFLHFSFFYHHFGLFLTLLLLFQHSQFLFNFSSIHFFFFLILFVQENCKTSYIYFLYLKFFIRFCII